MGVQVILELVFSLDSDRLTPELLDRCHKAFITFDEHLFSYPINLPGFGMSAGHSPVKAANMHCPDSRLLLHSLCKDCPQDCL